MKKSTLFKSIAAAALFVAVGMSANAQVTTGKLTSLPALGDITNDATLETTTTETVAVNAYMPYKVKPDATIAAATTIFNASGFKWAVTGGTLYKDATASGGLTTSAVAAANYFTESTVYIKMPGTATPSGTPITLSVSEKSNPKFSATAGCEGSPKTLDITVVDLPGVPAAATDLGGCSSSATYDIPYDFSSVTTHFPYYFSYTISYTDLQGAASGTSKDAYYRVAASGDKFTVAKADLLAVKDNGSGDLADGKYTITINNAWDQISVKALNRETAISSVTTAKAANLSSAIIKMPTPTTAPIQHIKNLE